MWLISEVVNVNVNLYSALSHSASNALNAPNNAEASASSLGDRSWRCWVLDHAGHCSVHSRRSDQSRWTHNGCTYRAVFLAWLVGSGWPNEDAVVQRLGRPAYTARTGSPGMTLKTLMHCHTELERDPICHIEPVQLSMTELSQTTFVFPCAAHHSRCSIHDSLQLVDDGFVASGQQQIKVVHPGRHRSMDDRRRRFNV